MEVRRSGRSARSASGVGKALASNIAACVHSTTLAPRRDGHAFDVGGGGGRTDQAAGSEANGAAPPGTSPTSAPDRRYRAVQPRAVGGHASFRQSPWRRRSRWCRCSDQHAPQVAPDEIAVEPMRDHPAHQVAAADAGRLTPGDLRKEPPVEHPRGSGAARGDRRVAGDVEEAMIEDRPRGVLERRHVCWCDTK